jgi:hypothetical protein
MSCVTAGKGCYSAWQFLDFLEETSNIRTLDECWKGVKRSDPVFRSAVVLRHLDCSRPNLPGWSGCAGAYRWIRCSVEILQEHPWTSPSDGAGTEKVSGPHRIRAFEAGGRLYVGW